MSQSAALCRNKVRAELKEKIELCRDKEFFCRDTIEEVCEEDYSDTLDSCRDIDQGKWQWNFVATILSMPQPKRMKIAYELYATKDDSIATEYGKVIIQVSYDKCFYVATKFSVEDQLKEGFLSLQKTKRREQKIGRDKEKYVVTQNTPVATKTRLLHQNYVTT